MMRSAGWKLRSSRIYDHHLLHHAAVLMIENVAVKYKGTWKIQEPVANPHAARRGHRSINLGRWDRNRIAPVVRRFELGLCRGIWIKDLDNLKRVYVDVKRVHGASPPVF